MNRRTLATRAIELCGGLSGFSIYYDPLGYGDIVTERRWRDKDSEGRPISCCQDLATRLALEACDLKQSLNWCNRVDGGNKWIPGWNLLRAKQHAAYAWKGYGPNSKWDIRVGDAVEVQNAYGPHTFVVVEITYNADGNPATCDHADYGQFHQAGGKPAGPSCRVYMGHPVTKDPLGNWRINGNRIIGRLDLMAIREKELGLSEEQSNPAPVEPAAPPVDTRVTEPPPVRNLKFCVNGDDVKAWQERLNKDGAELKPDGIFGMRTKKATQTWQKMHGLKGDGVVGPATRAAAGM